MSARAEIDLEQIATYTLRTWSAEQCARYVDELEEACRAIADNPALGRASDDIRPGLRRLEQGRHMLFYRQEPGGVRIVRILHDRMLPEAHDMDEG